MIKVGVAYGSDVEKALAIMEEIAKRNNSVLSTPEPLVTFEEFGDSALLLVLRCNIRTIQQRLSVISALHKSINKKFNDAGVVIAFPQLDVHLDTVNSHSESSA